MATILTPATPEIYERMTLAMKHNPDLISAGVVVEVLTAYSPDGGPAIKVHGNTALAYIKIVGAEERCRGGPDARIRVDLERYLALRPRQQEALFAHELHHLVVARTDDGAVKRDDYDRPVLKTRPDDWAITGFKAIHSLYGPDSIEQSSYDRLTAALGQAAFEFYHRDPDEPEPAASTAEARREGEWDLDGAPIRPGALPKLTGPARPKRGRKAAAQA